MITNVAVSIAIYLLIGLATIAFEILYCLFSFSVPKVKSKEHLDYGMIIIIPFWPYYWFCFVLDLISPLDK